MIEQYDPIAEGWAALAEIAEWKHTNGDIPFLAEDLNRWGVQFITIINYLDEHPNEANEWYAPVRASLMFALSGILDQQGRSDDAALLRQQIPYSEEELLEIYQILM